MTTLNQSWSNFLAEDAGFCPKDSRMKLLATNKDLAQTLDPRKL